MEASQMDPAKIKQHGKEIPLTRHRLESLSTGELVKLADRYGIDIPADMERIFIIEELLETASGSEHIPQNDIETNSHFMETAALPKQYNISYIEVMIRDPLWAFVFWEIKENDREIHEKAADFEGYCLRVVPVNEGAQQSCASNTPGESFTVLINANDTARYLGFPEDMAIPEKPGDAPCRCYIIKICVIRSAQEIQLAVSRPFILPRLIEKDCLNNNTKDINNLYQNPCIGLSGMRDFSVIKSTDRQLRAKRQ